MAREFQLVPPMTIHMGDPELLAGVWCASRECYAVDSSSRQMRETVAAAVSQINQCPYCVTVHTGMFASTGGDPTQLAHPDLLSQVNQAAYRWASATMTPNSSDLCNPQFPAYMVPQLFGTAVMYHYVNRMVSVFLGETPVALPGMTSEIGHSLVSRTFAFLCKRIVSLDPLPGKCPQPDSAFTLPLEFSWAATDLHIAHAIGHFAHAAEQAGDNSVPDEVRDIVTKHLLDWQGESPPISRHWIDDCIASLKSRHRSAARLALLSARAAYRVDNQVVQDFRADFPDPTQLLRTVSWASYAATRRIASWFPMTIPAMTEFAT